MFGLRRILAVIFLFLLTVTQAAATNFTMNVPGTSLRLPNGYPEAGGVAIVMIGANGNAYYQFSDPTGAFQGFQQNGQPAQFRGNPFTINNPIALDCGASTCSNYFGGSIAQMYVRFSAQDGDTGAGEFDNNDITLRVNGFDVSNWSTVPTEITNTAGTVSQGFATGFTNNTFNTGWVSTTNSALLSNILSTGSTTSQIFDRDPGDNFWDFRIGPTLTNGDIVTVAPGYDLTKTSPSTAFATVGQVITYNFVIRNIGSVPIRNITLQDDKIGAVTCTPTTLIDVNLGQTPNQATCAATYTITQADVDRGFVTNNAVAQGTPDFGVLGQRQATLTLPGPTRNPAITLDKATTLANFGNAGTVVPYTFTVRNTGNVTLTNVVVTDPLLPGLSCTVATLAPNATNTCSANYTVTQANVDAWGASNTQLTNTATVNARSPLGNITPVTDVNNLNGPTKVVSLTLDKVAQLNPVTAAGQVIPYRFTVRNTGNLTWPGPPTITDPLITGGVTCPAGTVAPGASVVCSANYTVTQANIDAGQIVNTASASVTAAGITSTPATDTETVTATRTPSFTFDKRLAASSPTSFSNAGVVLTYEFAFTNTGNTTLNSPAVTDPLIPSITCPASVAPGATAICTGSYTTTQANLEAGQVVNTATPRATPAGSATPITGTADSQTVPAVQTRSVSLDKTAPTITAAQFQVGSTVTYSYLVTNTGNVALPGPLTVIDDRAGTFQCQAGGLARGASVTCTRNYTFTSADILAGSVTNVATTRLGPVATGTTSNSDSVTIAPTLNPAISLTKAASPTTATSTATPITYTFTVTNTGNTQILLPAQPVTITDPRVTGATCSQPATLNPGGTFQCTATTTPTQAEVDAGSIVNRARASFPFTQGGQTRTFTTPEATATVTIPATPTVDVAKSGPATFGAVGSTITYNFVVTNTGNVTLTSGSVTDPRIPALACSFTNLAPNGTQNCSATYTIRQADIDAGQIINTASVTAATRGGATVTDTGTATVNAANATRSMVLDKVSSLQTYRAGQQISYNFRVQNTGTQTLTNVVVTDPRFPSFSCTIPTIAPNTTNTNCVFNYTATQADVDTGTIVNTAQAAAPGTPTVTDTNTATAVPRFAAYEFTKVADGPFTAAGDVVNFTLQVRNTGNTTLTNINVTDAFFNPDLSCTIATLAPNAADSSCVGAYTVTQADVNAGRITNTATIAVTPQPGLTPSGPTTATAVVPGPTAAPSMNVTKTPSTANFTAGQTVTFTFTVQNTGNVTLNNVFLNDPALGFSCALPSIAPNATVSACANSTPLSVTRVMTQADVDTGSYRNTVETTANSAAPGAAAINDSATVTILGPVQAPAMTVAKTGSPGTYSAVGQVITYNYLVTNTGNISLTAPITISDNRIANVTCPPTPAAGILPGDTLTCTATATITQANLDAGSLSNTATANTNQPVVPRNPGDPSTVAVTSPGDTETVTATQTPTLRLEKRVADGSISTFEATTQQITYLYTVTNTGNVTTTAPITITDNQIGANLSCTSTLLAPGQSATCTQFWPVTQAALNAGSVTNSATANTSFGGNPVVSPAASVTVPAQQNPRIAIDKTLVAPIPTTFASGEVLNYSYLVTNPGNVTLAAPFTVTDNLTTPNCAAVPATLAPGGSFTCEASYTISANDLALGSTTNTADAAATFAGNPVNSVPDSVTFPLNASPALTIEKSANGILLPDLGDTITYTYIVTNSGDGGFVEPVTVEDDKIVGPITCWNATISTVGPSFDPGETATCTADYVVLQADRDRGFVENTATANSIFAPGGGAIPVESPPASVNLPAQNNPRIETTKSVILGPNPAAVGDVLTYQIVVANIGDQTVFGVNATDPLIPTLSCSATSLLVNTSLTCSGTYTVTQADVDRGGPLLNTATSTATTPQGATLTHFDNNSHPIVTSAPSVEVTKVLEPDPGAAPAFGGPGDVLTFRVRVRNTGNVTLTSSTVTDALAPSATCSVGSLAPLAEDTSCTFTYTTTQADVDRLPGPNGGVLNTVSVTSQPAVSGSPTVSDTGTLDVLGPEQGRAFTLEKTADVSSFDAPGDVITYTYRVTNSGNVTLTAQPNVTDNQIASVVCDAIPAAGLAPGASLTCTATDTVEQADIDAGQIVNTAAVTSTDVPVAGPSAQATETVPATRTPLLQVAKVASVTTGAAEGDVITYTYTVTNAGNVTLENVTPADAHVSAAGTTALTIAGDTLLTDTTPANDSPDAGADGAWDTLSPGDVVTFTATYTVTQADVDAGADLTNTVTVNADGPPGVTVPAATATETVSVVPAAPGLDVQKRADVSGLSTPPVAGQEITYTITTRNTGNVTLSEPDLADDFRDANGVARLLAFGPDYVSGDTDGNLQLSVGETWTYTARAVVSQAILDSGGVSNTVTADARTPGGTPVIDVSDDDDGLTDGPDTGTDPTNDPTVTPFNRQPRLATVKTGTINLGGDGVATPGDVISYTYVVTNTGNTTLRDIGVTETGFLGSGTAPVPVYASGGVELGGNANIIDLRPGDAATFTASYTLTQADVDRGQVTNQATASGTDPAGGTVTDPSGATQGDDTPTVTSFPRQPALVTIKTANTSALQSPPRAGDVLTYTITVQNTGNISLPAPVLVDTLTSTGGGAQTLTSGPTFASGDDGDGVFEVAEIWTYTATFALTQSAIDAGGLSNTVTATATDPVLGPVSDVSGTAANNNTPTTTPLGAGGRLAVVKTSTTNLGADGRADVGDTISYSYAVSNTGNVTLFDAGVGETTFSGTGTRPVPTYASGGGNYDGQADAPDLRPGEAATFTATYTLTQADINAGRVTNQATATGATPGGAPVSDLSGTAPTNNVPTVTLLPSLPGIASEKTITAGPVVLGGEVAFLITATNTGNVTLTSVAITSERLRRADGTVLALTTGPNFNGASAGSPAGVLQPGEVASYVATYVLTQADIDAGGISNAVVLQGQPPTGAPVSDLSDNGNDADGNTVDDPTVLTIPATPSMGLVKQLNAAAAPTFDAVGDVLAYEFVVTNTGNVTLTNQIAITDPLITGAGGTITCPAPPVAPGATVTCTGSYTVTQADIDRGSVINSASASDGTTTSPPATLTVPADQNPGLTTAKVARPIAPAQFVVGAVVTYDYTVTNSGNVTITNPITINDNRIAAANLTCPPLPAGGLRPAANLVCVGTYTVTANDVDLGTVTNNATATDGTITSPIASETIPDATTPALTTVKTAAAGAAFAAVGDVLTYTYTVTNSGTRAFVQPVTVTDDKISAPITCFTPTATDPDFQAGEVATCTASYTVTQADIDAGRVTNQAFAQTTFQNAPEPVTSPVSTVTVNATEEPELTLTKSVTPNPATSVGQTLTYTLAAENTGNQTLRNVVVTDPLLPSLSCSVATLAPAATQTCTASYIVTQADVDRGTLVNTATVRGISPRGTNITDTGTVTADMPAAAPAIVITKTALPSPFGPVGSTLSYRLAVENTGNVTVTGITVTDPLVPGFSCGIASLAPGVTDQTCLATITVTQAQIDAGSIQNTAQATGSDPSETPVTDTVTITTNGPARAPAIEATKVLLPSASTVGSPVQYQLTLRNTGNTTLTGITPVDTMTRISPATAVTLDAPFALVSGDTNSDLIMLPGEVWTYTAQKTLTQDDIDAGGLSNSVTVTATPPTGLPAVTDVSDNGIDTDGNTTNDPTVFAVPAGPALEVTKVVTGPAPARAGDAVTFTITALNTGNVSISSPTIADTLTRIDGTALTPVTTPVTVPNPLPPGGTATWTVGYTLTQADVDAGGIRNTATVSGTDPSGTPVSDDSSNGDPTDGNTTDDPTEVLIPNAPAIEAIKTLTSIGDAPGEIAEFAVTVRNRGNTTLTGVGVTDSMTRLGGAVVTPVTIAFVSASNGSAAGTLIPDELATYRVTYTLVQADIDAGGLENTATATGQPPSGPPISDISDNDGGLGQADPTIATITRTATVAVEKALTSVSTVFPTIDRVTFTITVRNTGNTTQTNLRVVDDLAAFVAPATLLQATYPVQVSVAGLGGGSANPSYNGTSNTELLTGNGTLAPGASGTITVTATYSTANGQPAGANVARASSTQNTTLTPSNPVTVTRTDTDGDGVPDDVEGTGDRDGDGIPNAQDYDPTGVFYCEDNGQILPGGSIRLVQVGGSGASINVVRNGSDGQYQFFVTETGTYRLEITYPPGTSASTIRPSSGTLDLGSRLPTNPISVGSSQAGSTGFLANFAFGANPWFDTFQIDAGDPYIINNNIPVRQCAASAQDATATKVADRDSAVVGETVNFTLTFVNGQRPHPDSSFVDRLPVGLIYTPGSGQLNGVATEPTVDGQRLTWGPQDVAAGETVTIRLAARVSGRAQPGNLVNRAVMLAPSGTELSNTATATIRIVPEAVFDCSDVIGKVFDDVNRNGVQDPFDERAEITDQEIFLDKYGNLPPPEPEELLGEPGIPGVRIATVNGLLITTDEYGRFHVPCAALPADIGSNFTLKLDPRTLPVGYALTTENPRTLRLTPGKVAKMNFGVALTEMVDIGLTAQAFAPGTAEPVQALVDGVQTLIGRIADTPSTLRLTYLLGAGEDRANALLRLRATEDLIQRMWRGVGSYDLQIDKSVKE
jgi:large repetitive protein